MSAGSEAALELDLVRRVEAHAVGAWPASVVERSVEGWVLRATPGLMRGRSNHALMPCRPLDGVAELDSGLDAVVAFAERWGVRPGVQVSPLELHAWVLDALVDRGWRPQWPVLVLGAPVAALLEPVAGLEVGLSVADHADAQWLSAWELCEPGRADVEAHAATVFEGLQGRAVFGRFGADAVGIAVPGDGLVGLFCLAVAPELRRRGLGSALVRELLRASAAADSTAYLQVQEDNEAGLALYERLGFERLYSYVHCVAPGTGLG